MTVVIALGLIVFIGCNRTGEEKQSAAGKKQLVTTGKILFTVDFQKAQTLRYKFVSERDAELNWDPKKGSTKADKNAVQKCTESMEMVVAYTPVEVEPYGITTIRAKCGAIKVKRSKGPRKDAVEYLSGKSFTFTVDAAGNIVDHSELTPLIREAGKKAFRQGSKKRTKEPDMIDDFVSTQWFLWDSVSSIETKDAIKGIEVGQSWKSKLPVPTSMVLQKARDVVYTLEEIRPGENGRLAVISSSYSPAKSAPRWPIAYTGRFQLAGPLGFYRTIFKGFNVLSLQGKGQEIFNIDLGRTENYIQEYELRLEPVISPLPGTKPPLIIKQKLTMQLLEDK